MNKEKITPNMTIQEVLMVMSEGNVGAVNVLVNMLKNDPFGFLNILALDSMDIRGEQIWRLYKDCSGENIDKFIRTIDVLRLGGYTEEERIANLTNEYYSIPFLDDETINQGFPDYSEDFKPSDDNWDEYVKANRQLVVPIIEKMIKAKQKKKK